MRPSVLVMVFLLSLASFLPAQTQSPASQAKVPTITTMDDDALVASLPEEYTANRSTLYNDAQARFSPDGKLLAITVDGVWLYDVNSRQMVSVIKIPTHEGMPEFQVRDLAWSDDTLYVDTIKIRPDGRHPMISATMTGRNEISEFPPSVAALFQKQAASLPYARGDGSREEITDQYAVRSSNPSHGAVTLAMYPKNGSAPKDIADGSYELRSFLLDSARSLVIYPVRGQFVPSGIGIFDLVTRQSREIALPNGPEQLLAQTQDGTEHLVAYVVVRDCEPTPSSANVESQRPPPNASKADYLTWKKAQQAIPSHVCFAKLP